MEATAPGIWLMPSFNRAKTNLPRFFKKALAAGMTTPGAVLVDEADYAAQPHIYDALELPENWTVHCVKGGNCAAATEQGLAELFTPDMKWVGWLADDLVPETKDWDAKCIEALTGWNCVSTNDGKMAPAKMNGATIWSGDLVRAVGYLYPPGLKHWYVDTAWEDLGKMMNCWTILMDVMVRHVHHSWNPGIADFTTARTNKAWDSDEAAFLAWKHAGRLEAANRIGELMVQYGVSQPVPDLSHIKLMIATPCGSGKFERLYMSALFGTIALLRQCKAEVTFMEMPYVSDIALARNKLFGMFLRSEATHMMSIDDDMGWQPHDVLRLIEHKRDYVAVAGPRKVFPPSFAVQNADEMGRSKPIYGDNTGLLEVSHVGMAFALVTRNWAQRMAAGYQDLEFAGDDGRVEYAVFNPMVAHRRYMSEDYAACERWRAVGGKCYVDPSISLKHIGAYVWSGDWLSHLVTSMAEQQKSAA